MASLSDLLSENQKDKLIISTLKVGSVYRLRLSRNEGVVPKNPGDTNRKKYFIVAGFDVSGNAIGFVLINTEINVNLSKELKRLHYPLAHTDYPFLENQNRFVDCSEIKRITPAKFNSLLGSQSPVGQINETDMRCIYRTILESPTTSLAEMKRYGIPVDI